MAFADKPIRCQSRHGLVSVDAVGTSQLREMFDGQNIFTFFHECLPDGEHHAKNICLDAYSLNLTSSQC